MKCMYPAEFEVNFNQTQHIKKEYRAVQKQKRQITYLDIRRKPSGNKNAHKIQRIDYKPQRQ